MCRLEGTIGEAEEQLAIVDRKVAESNLRYAEGRENTEGSAAATPRALPASPDPSAGIGNFVIPCAEIKRFLSPDCARCIKSHHCMHNHVMQSMLPCHNNSFDLMHILERRDFQCYLTNRVELAHLTSTNPYPKILNSTPTPQLADAAPLASSETASQPADLGERNERPSSAASVESTFDSHTRPPIFAMRASGTGSFIMRSNAGMTRVGSELGHAHRRESMQKGGASIVDRQANG